MRLRDDERGQSVQIGAVLLFATLIIAFSSYQAFVVPQQNEAIEFNHNQQVQGELQDLRNAIVSMPGGGSSRSTSVTLGTTYPSRAIAQNPGPASGSLRTQGTGNERVSFSIRNATAPGETGDVWDGSRRSYETGAVRYDPGYNVYGGAPLSVYEHSVLYNEFRSGTIVTAEQTVVNGRTISLVAVNGSLERTSTGTTSVDVRPVSSSEETVLVEAPDDDSPVTVNVTSRLPVSRWQTLLDGEEHVRSVTEHPSDAPSQFRTVRIALDPGVTYRLQLTKVGVGTRVASEPHEYLTREGGPVAPVTKGQSRDVTVEVRDAYNNPVSGVSVNASVGSGSNAGSLAQNTVYTDEAGQATFTYETTGSTGTGTHQIRATTNASAALGARPFEGGRPKNVTVDVRVQGSSGSGGSSGGAYDVSWTNPQSTDGNDGAVLSDCSATSCTWDVGASDDDTLALESTIDPAYEGVDVDYAISNSPVGTVSPGEARTGPNGAVTTELTARSNGSVTVLATTDEGKDSVQVHVENVTTDGGDGSDGGTGSGNFVQYPYAINDGDGNSEPDEDNSIPPYDAARGDFSHGNFPSITQESESAALYPANGDGMNIGVALSVPGTAEYNASQYTLNIQYSRPGWTDPASVRVVDADGNVLQESTLLAGQNNLTMELNGEASSYFERHDDLYVVYHSQGNVNLEIIYHRLLGDS